MRRLRSHRYVKRIYAALMISSLVCQLQVIVVSTVALERLSRPYDKEVSVESFMRRYFDLEWIAVRLNFFVGVLSFVTAIGLRAWQASACVGIKFRAPHAIDATFKFHTGRTKLRTPTKKLSRTAIHSRSKYRLINDSTDTSLSYGRDRRSSATVLTTMTCNWQTSELIIKAA